ICGAVSVVNVSRPPGDAVCPACGSFLWVTAVVEVTSRVSFVPDLRIAQLEATRRDDAIQEMARAAALELNWTPDQEAALVDAVVKREELGSTGIGRGFAVPHASVDWLESYFTTMAFAPNGIIFNAFDGEPVHTLILIASPKSRREAYL